MAQQNRKIINAWAFYDWANSVYPLVITSTIFPIYFESVTHTETSDVVTFFGFSLKNTALYTFSLAFAYLLIAAISPLLSGIADYSGRKKSFMQFFCWLGAVSCASLFFFDAGRLELGILLVMLASIGYSGSIVFYNAFLPEIAPPAMQDKVSAKGYGMGYIGSSILLIGNLIVIMNPEFFGNISKDMASRIAFLTTGIWWLAFAQYTFFHLPSGTKKTSDRLFTKGYQELKKTWKALKRDLFLSRYLLAFFVYNMGVQTVMLVSTLFGSKELKLEAGSLIAVVLIIQFVAIGGAYLFSHLSGKKGNIFTLKTATLIWAGICIAGYFVKTGLQFYILAFMVGLVMGGIQSISRSTFSKMLPQKGDHASYFSFYDICDKCGIVLGMVIFGLLEENFSSMRIPVIALIVFFISGFILLQRVRIKSATPESALKPMIS